MSQSRPAVFLDRDGVINVDHGYVHRPDQIEWVSGAIESIRRLNDLGYCVVVVTNQAGVAHGHYDEDSVVALHAWMREQLAAQGAVVDAFYHCPYHPEGVVAAYRRNHIDRKPGPGMILRAFSEFAIDRDASFLIGDRASDLAAAQAAGIPGFLFGGGDLLSFLETCLSDRDSPVLNATFAETGGRSVAGKFPLLRQALPPFLDWIKTEALPFWGSVGVDWARGGFHERLDLDGHPLEQAPKRVMVQGRQLYVYCHAGLLGWFPDARRLADRCVDYMLASFYRPDGKPGFVHALAPDGRIADATRDTYGQAFALLGLAWYHSLTGDREILNVADAVLAFLDQDLATGDGGYLDSAPRRDAIRRQNPHMHLFEALLALNQATNDAKYLARAAGLFDVFATRLFQPASGTLCEYLSEDLTPLADVRGSVTEPGHHYEWICLLRDFARASGRDVEPFGAALYDHANRHGWDTHGCVVDEVDTVGAVVSGARRSWPHAEGLKANIVEGERGRLGCDESAVRCLARLTDTFIARPTRGGWIDHVDATGAPIVRMMPASTLYHLLGAAAAASRATRDSDS
jgi:D,D-heptose 1,7-bisphosphate phosphatase